MISTKQTLCIIFICAICTFSERIFPFLVFRNHTVPKAILYLGKVLPLAVMTTLVVYCLRGTTFTSFSGYVPPIVAAMATVFLHLWKRNNLLSILGGTICYMILIRYML